MVATSGCRTGLLLVAALAAAAWTAGAGRHDPFQSLEQAGSRRSLLQYPLFPYWGCRTYACACSPYNIQLTSVTQVPGQRTPTAQQTCFSVSYRGCDDSLPCCTALKDRVHKIGIRTTEACVRANIVGVTLNNRTHVSWNTYRYVVGTGFGYMVKIYDLQRNATTFPGTEVCITTVRGCESLTALCDTASGGQCTTVVSESPLHDYCPICSAGSLDASPPPTASSPPPSPSPAQPPSPLPPSPATPSVPLAPPPPSPATPALPLAPPPVSAPSPSYPAIPNSPAPPSPAPSSSPSPSPTRSPAPQTPQPSPAYPAPSPSPSTVPVPSYPAPSPAVYPTIPLPSPGSPPVAPPPAYPSIPLPSPPSPAAPAYPGFPFFPSPAAPAYPSPVSSPSPSSPDLPTPSPVTPPTGCIACVTLVRFASPFSQDECDLLAMTATQLYVTQYDDTILGPDGQPAAFTCSELGSRPDTDVRFMQNFVTACAALADQAMVDELYFNINAESDILALAYYEPFSLSCNIPPGQTQPIFPSDSVTFDNTCDSTERMFRPQCFRQRDPVAPSAPPPPSPSRLFPEHTCRTNQATPFTLDARLPAVPTERGSKYCFNVTTTPCADPASTCCQNALLTKVEMEIDYNLRRQVLWVWVNDDRRARSWGSSNSNVLKIAPLSLTTDLAASTTNTVCVELATGTSLEEACMGPACNYALFVDGGCCQLGQQAI